MCSWRGRRWCGCRASTASRGGLTQGVMALVFVALLLSALATDAIGIHAVFGAFALGAVIPHDSGLARELTDRLEDLVVVLLLPAFFAFTGMRTQIGLVTTGDRDGSCARSSSSWRRRASSAAALIAARLTGPRLARLGGARRAHEHARPDGADRAQHRPRAGRALADAVRDDGDHGGRHHVRDHAGPALHHARLQALRRGRRRGPQTSRRRRGGGVLVPISNPEGLASLLDLAHGRDAPGGSAAARVGVGAAAGGRQFARACARCDRKESPRSPVLAQAIDHARAVGAAIDAQALWTDDAGGRHPAMARAADDRLAAARLSPSGVRRRSARRRRQGSARRHERARGQRGRRHPRARAPRSTRHRGRRRFARTARRGSSWRRASWRSRSRRCTRCSCRTRASRSRRRRSRRCCARRRKTAGKWLHSDVLTQRNPARARLSDARRSVVIGMALADELGPAAR